jgi:large subunit ribosomal protein L7/L12
MGWTFNHVQPAAKQPVEPKPVEKKLEPADELKAYINTFLEDGMFDESEAVLIFQKAAELNISEDEAMDLMDAAQNQAASKPGASQSSDNDAINTMDMLDLIKEGDVRNIKSLFRTWQNAIASVKTDNEQYDAIQCLYYMVFAAVNPEGLIMEQESRKAKLISNYWRIYWAYIAYMKNGREAFAEDLLRKLQTFSQYDEDNVSLLETVAELNENGLQSALQFYKNRKADDRYSNELLPFAKALKMEIGMMKPSISGLAECAFITDNLIWWEDEDSRAERKARQEIERKRLAQEEAERNRRYYYLRVTGTPLVLLTADENKCSISKSELYKVAQSKSLAKIAVHTDIEKAGFAISEVAVLCSRKEIKSKKEAAEALVEWSGSAKDIKTEIPSISPRLKGYSIILSCQECAMNYQIPVDDLSEIDPEKLKLVLNPEQDDDAAYYGNKKLKEVKLDESEPEIVSAEMYLDKCKITAETMAFEAEQEAERKRVAAEQEKLRKQLTYTIKIIAVTNQLSAMFALRKALDWDAADTRSKLANLPYKVLETSSTKEAKTLYEQLADAGLTLKVTAINGLGEKVKADFTATAEAPAPAPASAKATVEVTFDVVLRNAGKYILQVVKVVKDIAHLGLKEAKDIVDGAPSIVKKGVDKATAMRMKKALEDVGAKVEIV